MPALSERPPLLDADQTSLALQLWQAAAAGDMKGVKDVRAKADPRVAEPARPGGPRLPVVSRDSPPAAALRGRI